ncbi:MAG: hypothetical protein L3J41_09700 [Melioribacteraceae bacterium]|nr:hypothetical protein [Melioribacteraceae bacterium]
MIRLISILLIISSQLFSQNIYTNSDISKTIITNNDLKNSGVINISDVFNLLNNWNNSTINGYSFAVSPNNLSLYQNQNVLILIDGQKVDLGEQDFINLNLIPLTIDQIDTVEIISFPQLNNGEYAQNGVINFITKKPTKGLSFNLFNSVGNEVGDPGPYVFTQERSPNVDKLGYLLSFNLNTSGENWYLRSFIKTEENYLTDPAIIDRINSISSDNKSRMLAASVILNFNALSGNHNFLFGYTENDDFVFYRQIGGEAPTNNILKHIGINGTFNLSQNIDLNYFVKNSNNEIKNRTSAIYSEFFESTELFLSRLESKYKNKNISLLFGLSYENQEISLLGNNNEFNMITLYTSLNYFFSQRFNYAIDFSTTKQNGETLFNGTLKNFWRITTNNNLTFAFSYSQNLFINNTYSLFPDNYRAFMDSTISDAKSNLFSSVLLYSYNLNKRLKINLSGDYRHFFNYTLEDYNYQFYTLDRNIESNYNLKNNEFLKVASGSVEIEHIISEVVKHNLYYSYQTNFEGSSLFSELWKSLPTHKFVYSINFNFNNSFGIWAKYYYQSETSWSQYRYLDFQSTNESSSKSKAYSTIDLSAQKWFWQKRVWLNLVFKDILNNRKYFHPIGAGFDMRFYLQFHLYFHSILI